MSSDGFSFESVYTFLIQNGGKVKNRDCVRHFKKYLTDPATKDQSRQRFKEYVNSLAHTRVEDNEKFLILKTKYRNLPEPPVAPLNSSTSSLSLLSPHNDPRNNVGLPLSPIHGIINSLPATTSPKQPPPYRNPPPVVSSPCPSADGISLSSLSTLDDRPQTPPRPQRKNSKANLIESERKESMETPEKQIGLSVKERTQQFNRLASVEDDLSPRGARSSEKDRSKSKIFDATDIDTLTPIEPKKCLEWCITASRADCQELLKLARDEPRLVNKKDPFSATVLHWGAKFGNPEIIKIFAGKYKVDVNGRTNGGYTPLHIAAQFGHREVFKLLTGVYKADPKIRDYSGRTAEYYLLSKEQKENSTVTLRKIKGRKKQSEKDLGFLRIGSLNVRVKKTTEAFSNFLGVGGSGSINPTDTLSEKVHKGWGSADNVNKDIAMGPPKGYGSRKKSKRATDTGLNSTPSTPKTPVKNYSSSSLPITNLGNDSDSDTAAGFDSSWKN